MGKSINHHIVITLALMVSVFIIIMKLKIERLKEIYLITEMLFIPLPGS